MLLGAALGFEQPDDPGLKPAPRPGVEHLVDVDPVDLVKVPLDQPPLVEECAPGDFRVPWWRRPLEPRFRFVPLVEARPRVDFAAADPPCCFDLRCSRFWARRSGSPAEAQ